MTQGAMTMGDAGHRERSQARLAAVQALYQMEASGAGAESVILEFRAHRLGAEIDGASLREADPEFFADIARGAVEAQRRIDPFIARCLAKGWTLARLDATARAILRAAFYELMKRPDIPCRAVIDEYVSIANGFFDGAEPKFINAVLDRAAREARPDEFAESA